MGRKANGTRPFTWNATFPFTRTAKPTTPPEPMLKDNLQSTRLTCPPFFHHSPSHASPTESALSAAPTPQTNFPTKKNPNFGWFGVAWPRLHLATLMQNLRDHTVFKDMLKQLSLRDPKPMTQRLHVLTTVGHLINIVELTLALSEKSTEM